VRVLLQNNSGLDYEVARGKHIAQLVIHPLLLPKPVMLQDPQRQPIPIEDPIDLRRGGFGSTDAQPPV